MEKQPKPTFTVPMDGYTATLENGMWKYSSANIEKANQGKPIAKYKDPVQFKVVEKYEGISEDRYRKQLGLMTLEIATFLNRNSG